MENLKFNTRLLVKDSSHIGLLYYITLEQSTQYNDLIIVHDELYNEDYYLTEDEILEEFEFLG